nr:hypothetical protein [Candidatus Acidoferrales bacterium]
MTTSRGKGIDFILKKLRTAGALGILALMVLWIGGVARAGQSAAAANGATPHVVKLVIDGEIEPILAEYLDAGLDRAAEEHAGLVLITMDTPGGLSDSMEQIIQHILRSPVPVAIYVEPAGSRAASAGFFILLSADVAAMAPGTHTGAAS